MQVIPGNSFPLKKSKDAPPPVEIWLKEFLKPDLLAAEAESPPPTTEYAKFFSVVLAIALQILSVPFLNTKFSKTPTGPFQIIVFAFLISLIKSLIDFLPKSYPDLSAGNFLI